MSLYLVKEIDGVIQCTAFVSGIKHSDINTNGGKIFEEKDIPSTHPNTWILEGGKIKVDSEKLAIHKRTYCMPSINKRQFILALLGIPHDEYENLGSYFHKILDDNIEWKYEYESISEMERMDVLINDILKKMSIDDSAIDEIWTLASTK